MSESSVPSPRRGRSRKWIYWILGLVALYTAFGFLVVPRIVESVMRSQVDAALNAEFDVERVAFNPLTLRLEIEALRLSDTNNDTVLTLAKGRFVLSLKSVVRFAGILREVELQQPELFVARFENGDINLLGLLSEDNFPANGEDDPEANLPRLGITRLIVEDGRVEFSDRSLEELFNFGFHPISFELNDFTTFREEGNQLNFRADDFYGGNLRGQGEFSPQDLTASLNIELAGLELSAFAPYVSEFVDLNLNQGQLSLNLKAALDAKAEEEFVKGTVSDFEIRDFKVFTYTSDDALIELDHMALGTLEFGAFEPWLKLDSATIGPGQARLVLLEGGTPEIIRLIPQTGASAIDPANSSSSDAIELPVQLQVGSVRLEDFKLLVEDQSLPQTQRLEAAIHLLEMRDISDRLDQSISVDLSGELMNSSRFGASGTIAPLPLLADLQIEVEDLPFAAFNPWLAEFIPLEITSGTGFAHGRVNAEQSPSESMPLVFFTGESGIDRLEVTHQEQTIAGLNRLRVDGIDFDLGKRSLKVEDLTIEGPLAEIQRNADGQLNWLTLIPQPSDEEAAETAVVEAPGLDEIPLNWTLAQLEIRDGQVGFADDSVSPAFSTRMENMQLHLKDLSSDPAARSELRFSGRFPDAGTVEIDGLTNANPVDPFANLNIQLTGFGLPATSGYSGQFVGRAIAQGRLDLSIEATVVDENLSASNALLVRNLSLGDRVDHPDALSLPLDLAVSLLRNRRGEISLNIPLSGRLDDPQFSIASVASQAFSTVIGNIVTSPFSILGNLVGARAEELSQVVFEAGSATLRDNQREPIADLAEALYQRPALTLEILAYSDRRADREALAESSLQASLRSHYEDLHGETASDTVEYWENKALILSYYEQTFGPIETEDEAATEAPSTQPARDTISDSDTQASTQGSEDRNVIARFFNWLGGGGRDTEPETAPESAPEPPVAASPDEVAETETEELPDISTLRSRLLDNIEISDDELLRLGRDRANTVQAALLSNLDIEAERVQIGTVQLSDASKVEFDVR